MPGPAKWSQATSRADDSEDLVFNGCESRSTCKWKRKLIQKKNSLKVWWICVGNSLRNHSPIRDELGQ